MWYARTILVVAGSLLGFSLVACGSETPAEMQPPPPAVETGLLVVNGSAQAPPPGATSRIIGTAAPPIGAPSTMLVGLYSFHVSSNADCSGPFVTVFSSGGSPAVKDFVTNPELFRAEDAPTGMYPCVAMRISDVLEFQSATSSGACVAGVTYRGDIYRAGGEDVPFLDLTLTVIPATGSDAAPSDDQIYVFFSTNASAAVALGFAPNQVVTLSTALVVPDAVTFYWDVSNAVVDNTTACVLEPEAPALFR